MANRKSKFSEWFSAIGQNKWKVLLSLIFLVMAVSFYAASGYYVSERNYSAVSDLVLNNIGPYDLSFVFTYLFALVVVVFLVYSFVYIPKKFHSITAMLGLFVIVRSIFMLLTHIGVPADAIKVSAPGPLSFLTFTNDLFFSGHTGLPFLGFLIFRKYSKSVGYFMLVSSIILASTVLLMHIHYTIDVFAAFFITYGIYKIGEGIFAIDN
jgi:hypothetical protein